LLEGIVLGFHEVGRLEFEGAPYTPSAGCTPIESPKTYAVSKKGKLGKLPVNVDWHKKNIFSPIKNQGPCGQCWSYAIIGALEATAAQFVTKKVAIYSTQQLVDCVNEGQCIDGQWPGPTLDYITSCGINLEKEYPPSLQCGSLCTPKPVPPIQKLWPSYEIILGISSTLGDRYAAENAMVDASALSPGIVFIMDIIGSEFENFGWDVANKNRIWWPKNCTCKRCGSHLMQIVGYGVETKGDQKGTQYWWVRNSWGKKFGDNGYVKIVRGFNGTCSFAQLLGGAWLIRTGVNGG